MGQRAKCELIVRCCSGPEISLVWSGEGPVVMATLGLEFSRRRARGVQEVEGCEECPPSPKAKESLPGAVVHSRKLQKVIWKAQSSAQSALLTRQGLLRTQLPRTRE